MKIPRFTLLQLFGLTTIVGLMVAFRQVVAAVVLAGLFVFGILFVGACFVGSVMLPLAAACVFYDRFINRRRS